LRTRGGREEARVRPAEVRLKPAAPSAALRKKRLLDEEDIVCFI
jgi:hypothetical protein